MAFLLPTVPGFVDTDVPCGYALRPIQVFDKDRLKKIGLILPDNDDIDKWLLQHAEKVKTQAAQFENAELERHLASRQAGETSAASPTTPPSNFSQTASSSRAYQEARSALKADHDGMASELSLMAQSGVAMVRVYAWDEPLKLIGQTGPLTANRHLSARDQGLYEKLKDLGAFRTISHRDTYAATLTALDELSLLHPQFSDVIDFLKARIILAREVASPVAMPPILLIGPPGVGKTHFTLALAKAMHRPIQRHSFDADYTNSALTGSDRHWSNTKTGLLFDTLCLGERADPIILLDELDKADSLGRGNPLQPLLSLLEPVTAQDVVDISVGIRFDATHVFWIATANELQCVPAPIQSRFRIFNLQAPSAGQALDLARAVARSVHQRFPTFEAPLRDLALQVAHLTPREQIQALEQAFASAAANGRKHLVRQDLPGDVLNDLDEVLAQSPLLH
ncbi:MAG: AAA family ATPase [Hydrogenophaga sp.]|uniref:AAA family ATPase n=1 Tax=Comamonadaceae TaxID=80864 RepID=UPI00272FD2BA|nr:MULTISPECIES: AAA family ATPase [Comamonadaceae]MDP2440208.1 AAA family ATPase [Rhodoferax sp.]MDZ4174362.1 AAA family ATPase [Hydrogenophaga sp.]